MLEVHLGKRSGADLPSSPVDLSRVLISSTKKTPFNRVQDSGLWWRWRGQDEVSNGHHPTNIRTYVRVLTDRAGNPNLSPPCLAFSPDAISHHEKI